MTQRKTTRILAVLGLVSVLAAGAAFAVALDGTSFEVTITQPDGGTYADVLIFADGTFDSVECRSYGFGPVSYEARTDAGTTSFSATATSDAEGRAVWSGTLDGDTISGTMTWTREGHEPETYTFRGTRRS